MPTGRSMRSASTMSASSSFRSSPTICAPNWPRTRFATTRDGELPTVATRVSRSQDNAGGLAACEVLVAVNPDVMLAPSFRGCTSLIGSVRLGQAEHVRGHVVERHLLAHRREPEQARLAEVAFDVVLLRVPHAAVSL